ncbi:unnamed protein product [Onchocerca flexuosa]|uniref:BESS domain-containing protein n=1 Tax=Onchocerca flexuosa TaxID=387005 RepID=A0A183GZD9_9BILA|nr:unnamed protein product [Onchocerca flexuosa]
MADSESGKCDEEGHKVQHWIHTDQSKIYSTIEETVKSISSDHQQRRNDPLEGTMRNRCRFSISDILSDKHPTSHAKINLSVFDKLNLSMQFEIFRMGSMVTKTCITTSTTETGIVSVSLPAAVSINDEVPSYISSQLPRFLHTGILQQPTQNPWFQPWLSTVRPSIAQQQNLAYSDDKKKAERVHEIS